MKKNVAILPTLSMSKKEIDRAHRAFMKINEEFDKAMKKNQQKHLCEEMPKEKKPRRKRLSLGQRWYATRGGCTREDRGWGPYVLKIIFAEEQFDEDGNLYEAWLARWEDALVERDFPGVVWLNASGNELFTGEYGFALRRKIPVKAGGAP